MKNITKKDVSTLSTDPTTLTVEMGVSAFTMLDTAYGATSAVIRALYDLAKTDNGKALAIGKGIAGGFGVGGKGSVAHRKYMSFKTLTGRLAKDAGIKFTCERDSDNLVTDAAFVKVAKTETKTATKTKTKTATDTATDSQGQHVDHWKSAKSIVAHIMDKKPKNMKLTTLIIAMIDALPVGAGAVAVFDHIAKRIDADRVAAEKAATKKAS